MLTEERLAEIQARRDSAKRRGHYPSLVDNLILDHDIPDLMAEVDRLRAIVDRLLCKATDGVHYARYDPQEVNPPLWVVWRYGELEPWRVSKAKAPTTPDEISTDFDVLIEDADDQCLVLGVFGTQEAAEAAKDNPNGR